MEDVNLKHSPLCGGRNNVGSGFLNGSTRCTFSNLLTIPVIWRLFISLLYTYCARLAKVAQIFSVKLNYQYRLWPRLPPVLLLRFYGAWTDCVTSALCLILYTHLGCHRSALILIRALRAFGQEHLQAGDT